jgi:hypothetical protein
MRLQLIEYFIVAAIAAFLTLNGPCRESLSLAQSQVMKTTSKRAAHFDSDLLMKMLRQEGIHAEYGGDMVFRPDVIGLSSESGLAEVLRLNVDKPLSETQEKIVARVATRFFQNPANWNHEWRYKAIACQPPGGKMRIIKIDYSTRR